jgi:thioredoxin-dependent peroxiredoxin
MAKITLKGNAINTYGNLPAKGSVAPEFKLTKTDLSDVSISDFKGKKLILNIFPSLDTSVCATSVRKFNAEASKLPNTVVLCISRDLPFAHSRFCSTEGLNNVVSLSQLRDDNFGKSYGVQIVDGPMAGLFSRALVVVDENGKVIYTEQVPEIVQEPDYASAIKYLS